MSRFKADEIVISKLSVLRFPQNQELKRMKSTGISNSIFKPRFAGNVEANSHNTSGLAISKALPDTDQLILQPDQEKRIEQELKKLRALNPGRSIFFRKFGLNEATLKARATYNVTRDADALNSLLPYRESLSGLDDSKALKKYDILVKKIIEKSEFYEVPSLSQFRKQLTSLMISPPKGFFKKMLHKIGNMVGFPILLFVSWLRPVSTASFFNRIGKRLPTLGNQVPANKIQSTVKAASTPLKEPATRYLVATGVAELLHQHPDYANVILNKALLKNPLRFMIGNEKTRLSGGYANPGINIIGLNRQAIWKYAENKKHIARHEFVHLLSEKNGMNWLPFMSNTQHGEFKKARKALKQQYLTQDCSWLGGLKSILPFKFAQNNSTGIQSYGYFNNMEFLTVSIDTFMEAPQQLCKTEPGKKLYEIYKNLFSLDPLKEVRLPAKTSTV